MQFPLAEEIRPPVSPMAWLSPELSRALAENNTELIDSFVRSTDPREVDLAIDGLAKTKEGRAKLRNQLKKGKLPRFLIEQILARLADAGSSDAVDSVVQFAATAQSPRAYGAAIEAAAKAMPPEQGRLFCLEEAKKLAADPDFSPEMMAAVVRGLAPQTMRNGDPEETTFLREIIAKKDDPRMREACLDVLGQWVVDGADLRERIAETLAAHLGDSDPRVRARMAGALGRSGDIRRHGAILPLLDDPDPRVSEAAAEAARSLLDWPRPETPNSETMEQRTERVRKWTAEIKTKSEPVRQGLEALEKAIQEAPASPTPKP
jgi:hypothetical protein